MKHLTALSDIDLSKVVHEVPPPRESLYLKAGSPTRCQNPHCKKPFDRACVRGDDDQYYCSELCANEGFDHATVVPVRKRTSET